VAAEAAIINANSIVGIVIDLSLVALPVCFVYSTMKYSSKVFQVMGVFCVGLFAVSMGAVRLNFNEHTDVSVDLYVISYNFLRCHSPSTLPRFAGRGAGKHPFRGRLGGRADFLRVHLYMD
jgi:hypothetical protein